jgi:hypothetical protein
MTVMMADTTGLCHIAYCFLSHGTLLENNYLKTWRVQLPVVMFGAALTVRASSLEPTSLSSSYISRHNHVEPKSPDSVAARYLYRMRTIYQVSAARL